MPQSQLTLTVTDSRTGKIKERVERPFRSFVVNFLYALKYAMGYSENSMYVYTCGESKGTVEPYYPITKTLDTSPNPVFSCSPGMSSADANRNGIIVGKSDTPVTISDSSLGYYYFNANSVGTGYSFFAYSQWIAVKDYSGTPCVRLSRQFYNGALESATIKEVGLVGRKYGYTTSFWLMARDVLDTPLTIDQFDILDVVYRIYARCTPSIGFTNQFITVLAYAMDERAVALSGTSTTGATLNIPVATLPSRLVFALHGGAYSGDGIEYYNVVVGSGATPVVETQYALQTQIMHGTGAGQLSYGHWYDYNPVATSGNFATFAVVRRFENMGTGSVSIREFGIYAMGPTETDSLLATRYMLLRGVTPTAITLYPGDVLTVTIQFEVSCLEEADL
jgi:hypothetical protein